MQICWKYSSNGKWRSLHITLLCAILQMLHFELSLTLLLVPFRYYTLGSLVVPFPVILMGHLLSQDLVLREIHQIVATMSIKVLVLVVLPAMMVRTHSKVLAAAKSMVLTEIAQLVSVVRS
jgi:hypothetical protein